MHALLVLSLLAFPQDRVPAPAHPKVDQAKVDEAIKRGVEYLKRANLQPWNYHNRMMTFEELVLLTLIHAGEDIIAHDDPFFDKVLKTVVERPLHYNYVVVLKAMSLSALDKEKYLPELRQCAQHLLDNQCKNGQWSYGEPVKPLPELKTESAAAKKQASSSSTQVRPKIPIQRRGQGPERGDNSNTQYAALGIRACWEAGVEFPRDSILLAKQWWEQSQRDDGGWSYGDKDQDLSRGSMAAGAVASLCIYNFMLGTRNIPDNPAVKAGSRWLGKHFSVTENPLMARSAEYKTAGAHYYYYLYGLERAGMLVGTEKFGDHEWYPDGAHKLLEAQRGDGSWHGIFHWTENPVWDTCFAILFLRRATAPLKTIKTESSKK
jgi:hypothetical protein